MNAAKQSIAVTNLKADLNECLLRDRLQLGRQLERILTKTKRAPNRNLFGELNKLRERIEKARKLGRHHRALIPEVTYPDDLPITLRTDEIRDAIKQHQVVIISGETGSGKTTQLPKICLEAGRGQDGRIVCTQPRRVAALSLSQRLAEELAVNWGKEVGCKIRFSDQTSSETIIKLVTDGMLLNEIRSDANLLEYDTVILDEAHERSLNTDFLLGYMRLLLQRRADLKLIITSATIDIEKFSKAFGNAHVIEVVGRTYPVEVRHLPMEELLGSAEEYSYVEAAVTAVQQLLDECSNPIGDFLVFMPGEQDIRETSELLASRISGPKIEILPLFSRLTAAEQRRVFTPSRRRRVVIATNVAETSITIPGISYVIDPGLARVNRYNPRTHTQRLPIESISRSSAEQRKGRCGRTSTGVCIRLYSKEDFAARPKYTAPEIQRSDLADVILRMIDLQLGKIEEFPFVDSPNAQAINNGYLQLKELGALDDQYKLTPLGRTMARMPIAPTVSRMILQARAEGALPEVLVIAAAISIQDPRERPLDRRSEADIVHRQFLDPNSDFLTLLNIWKRYHANFKQLKTQNQMRKFCRANFLSYTRMREWRDIHTQLIEVLSPLDGFRLQDIRGEHVGYDSIHRSIVTGLIGNIANKKEPNRYRATRNREVMIFPGSGLFQRNAVFGHNDTEDSHTPVKESKTPEWIVASEIVETSRVFARTVALIRSSWLPDLAGHLCRSSYGTPFWSRRAQRVLAQETIRLYGLHVANKRVPFQRINPREATNVFIRDALLTGDIDTPHGFLIHNRQLVDRIETWQTRTRRSDAVDLDAVAFSFYEARIGQDVSSIQDLNRIVNSRSNGDLFLYMGEADLLAGKESAIDRIAFPDEIDLNGEKIELAYAYKPGQEDDGVTLQLPYRLIDEINQDMLDWLIPGMFEEKIIALLRSLPKQLRKKILPIPKAAQEILTDFRPIQSSFIQALQEALGKQHGLPIKRSDWTPEFIPQHLLVRVSIQGPDGQVIAAGRNYNDLCGQLQTHDTPLEQNAWTKAVANWSREGIVSWDFDDLPVQIEVTCVSGVPLFGYPGLECVNGLVNLRLFKSRPESDLASQAGIVRLSELVLKESMQWLRRKLNGMSQLEGLCLSSGYGKVETLQQHAYHCIVHHLFVRKPALPMTRFSFEEGCRIGCQNLPDVTSKTIEMLTTLLGLRRELVSNPKSYSGMEEDLNRLLPPGFVAITDFEMLPQICRYVRGFTIRADRARSDAGKDKKKAEQISAYQTALNTLMENPGEIDSARFQHIQNFRWMLEEWRISVFAQELGTAKKVSPNRLDEMLDKITCEEL